MKKNVWFIWGLVLIMFSLGCLQKEILNSVYHIEIESNKHKLKKVSLSQFTGDIKYIPMEIKEDLVFAGIWDCIFSDTCFLARDLSKCLLYNYEGKVIVKIGNRGRGPGEYRYVNNVEFGEKKVYLQSTWDLLEYRFDGSFLDKHENFFTINNYHLGKWLPLNDTLFFGKIETAIGNESTKALIMNLNGRLVKEFENYIIFQRERTISSDTERHANIYPFQNETFYKELHNDTLFYLSTDLRLVPRYIINMGKYSVPVSMRKKLMQAENNFIAVNNVFQTSDYLFLDTNFGIHFPARRLTQKVPPIPIQNKDWGWYNTTSLLGIYDKTTHRLVFSKPTSTDNPLFSSGLYNDIDGGPRFFPKKQVNDSTLAMWIDAKQLKDHVASDDFKFSVPKYPEKKKKLEELVNKITEFDNPVLILVTFKSK